MKSTYLLAAAALLLATQPLAAKNLSDVIVTASRTAETTDETLAAVTVITREDIERVQAQSVSDVLRSVPGLNISNTGGPGKNTSVFMRGGESDHVLVLINGVKTGSATVGLTPFHHIPIELIERIEVVRGPRSSLYGSEAIGGVIQIFTRKGGQDTKPYFSLGAGRYDTYSTTLGVSGGGQNSWYNLSANQRETDGFNSCDGNFGAGCFTIEPDDDGYRNQSVSLRGGHRFSNGVEIDTFAQRAENDSRFDGGFQNESDTLQQTYGGSLRFSPTELWQVTLTAGNNRDESRNFKDAVFASRFDSERQTFSLQNDLTLSDNQMLILGGDYQQDWVSSDLTFVEDSRDNKGVFAQYQGQFDAHRLQMSVREDHNEQFGSKTTGSVAWGYALTERVNLVASWGTAFKAPSFNELYYPFFGNPNLDPESSRSFELGLNGRCELGNWSINLYETDVDDLIAFDSMTFAPANIDRSRLQGAELSFNTQLQGWSIQSNLTLQNPRNLSNSANNNNLLARRSQQVLHIDADKQFGVYALGASLHAEDRRFDNLSNTRRLGGFATFDLRGEYNVAKDWRLQARIENLLDKNYETAAFYNQPGRSLFLTLRYQP
ncbi:MAG TPA: TonB-dependent vitamin B12 receptor [Xanthomonadales bacterium]|nr:TonB-dependent vitamin B12 receptor [Xanthomonadales bacterium]